MTEYLIRNKESFLSLSDREDIEKIINVCRTLTEIIGRYERTVHYLYINREKRKPVA